MERIQGEQMVERTAETIYYFVILQNRPLVRKAIRWKCQYAGLPLPDLNK